MAWVLGTPLGSYYSDSLCTTAIKIAAGNRGCAAKYVQEWVGNPGGICVPFGYRVYVLGSKLETVYFLGSGCSLVPIPPDEDYFPVVSEQPPTDFVAFTKN
jgi:hypothetical protein